MRLRRKPKRSTIVPASGGSRYNSVLKTEPASSVAVCEPQPHLLGDIDRQNRLAAVVSEALEQLERIRDPESPAVAACARSNVTWPLL